MKYFKNTELAKSYHVSEKSVRNWIDAAKQQKLDLQLIEAEGKTYIANTTKNVTLISQLVTKGEKYKNKRGYKLLTPLPEFYELYDSKQIFEIISSLNIRKEIPMQFNYINSGGAAWDRYATRLSEEHSANMLLTCRDLLETNLDSLDRLVGSHKQVNIIDIGVGNGIPVRGLIQHFIDKGLLNRYIGIDASKTMLDIDKKNLTGWFDSKAQFEFYERDITHEEFGDLLAYDYFQESDIPLNIILLFGGTLANFEVPDDVLRIINRSMQPEDLFICQLKLDTENSRRFFDFDADPSKIQHLAGWQRIAVDLLNLDESLYDVVHEYNEEKNSRFIGARLKVDVSIKFTLNKAEHVVKLHKGDIVKVFRYRHLNAESVARLLNKNGFGILQTSLSRDFEYILTISGRV